MRLIIFLLVLLALPKPSEGYSLLTHEAVIDEVWDAQIVPLLKQRFPNVTAEELKKARAFSYGGAIMPDMGYFPFGSRFFTNLLHYTRSGDFTEALIEESHDLNEYAFALGALAHYNADNYGHPEGVNPSVPLVYPKMKRKYGDTITYEQSPISHKRMEFGFDVLQVARGNYADTNYVDLIGFEVAKPVLERAFERTYNLKLSDVFMNLDLAISTFRWSVKDFFPMLTRASWANKKDDIQKQHPGITRRQYSYRVNKHQYIQAYHKVPFKVRVVSLVLKVMPKFGLARALRFKVPTAEAEKKFFKSFDDVVVNYTRTLQKVKIGQELKLANLNFDTGRLSRAGEYKLADDTYCQLMEKLADTKFAGVSPGLEQDILNFYAGKQSSASHSIAELYPKVNGTR